MEQEAGPLSVLDMQFVQTITLAEFERFADEFAWLGNGRRPAGRLWLMHAFAAKSVYQFPTTSALIHALLKQPTSSPHCAGCAGLTTRGRCLRRPRFPALLSSLPAANSRGGCMNSSSARTQGASSWGIPAAMPPPSRHPKSQCPRLPKRSPRGRANGGAPPGAKRARHRRPSAWTSSCSALWKPTSPNCPAFAPRAPSATAPDTRKAGSAANRTSTWPTGTCP